MALHCNGISEEYDYLYRQFDHYINNPEEITKEIYNSLLDEFDEFIEGPAPYVYLSSKALDFEEKFKYIRD
jgi:hypothetical protein